MVALVTIQQVKQVLRIDTDDDDAMLGLLIGAASRRVIQHLKGQAAAILDLDSGGDLESGASVPDDVSLATIMLVGYLYRNPDQDPERDFELGKLPLPVKAILYMLRDPALA